MLGRLVLFWSCDSDGRFSPGDVAIVIRAAIETPLLTFHVLSGSVNDKLFSFLGRDWCSPPTACLGVVGLLDQIFEPKSFARDARVNGYFRMVFIGSEIDFGETSIEKWGVVAFARLGFSGHIHLLINSVV